LKITGVKKIVKTKFLSLLLSLFCMFSTVLLAGEPFWQAKVGPWGELDVHVVYLQPPETLLAAVVKPNSVPHWTFDQMSPDGVKALLARVGVPVATINHLFREGRVMNSNGNVSLYPELDDLLSLNQEVRSALYSELAKFAENEYQHDPVFILGNDVEDWLEDAPLNLDQKDLFKKLLWKRGNALVYSDIRILLTLAKNSEEVMNVFRAVTRVRSLLVDLRIPLKTNRQDFMDYWSAGQTDARRLTFLKAITERRAPQTVDITHFLPALMRERIYTFPDIDLGLKGRFPDCHWTSLNFFNRAPRDYFLDTRLAAAHLVENYNPVEAPYHYGDVLCFLDKGEGIHTCVYIADDIVLTKNGDGILAPWVLMQIKDVDSIYRRSTDTRIQGYRSKS
jgi:hypothetical protein